MCSIVNLENLNRFNPPSSPLRSEEQTRFDLYACVNHFGSAGSGHYTAFCKHGPRQQWQLYNDSDVQSDRLPGQGVQDQKAAYVLFYERKGGFALLSLNYLKSPPPPHVSFI